MYITACRFCIEECLCDRLSFNTVCLVEVINVHTGQTVCECVFTLNEMC